MQSGVNVARALFAMIRSVSGRVRVASLTSRRPRGTERRSVPSFWPDHKDCLGLVARIRPDQFSACLLNGRNRTPRCLRPTTISFFDSNGFAALFPFFSLAAPLLFLVSSPASTNARRLLPLGHGSSLIPSNESVIGRRISIVDWHAALFLAKPSVSSFPVSGAVRTRLLSPASRKRNIRPLIYLTTNL